MDTELDSTLSEQDALTADPAHSTSQDAKADPAEVDYKTRYAALKKDYDKIVSERKHDEPKVEPVTDEIDWKIENAARIKLVKPELQTYLAKGIPKDEALRLAELDKGITKSSSSDVERQAATSSAPSYVQRATAPKVTLTEHDERFGITADRKAELLKKYPDLADEL